jgi:hypothetical protein
VSVEKNATITNPHEFPLHSACKFKILKFWKTDNYRRMSSREIIELPYDILAMYIYIYIVFSKWLRQQKVKLKRYHFFGIKRTSYDHFFDFLAKISSNSFCDYACMPHAMHLHELNVFCLLIVGMKDCVLHIQATALRFEYFDTFLSRKPFRTCWLKLDYSNVRLNDQ